MTTRAIDRATRGRRSARTDDWGAYLAARVVDEVAAMSGGRLRPESAQLLSDVTLRGYRLFVAILDGDEGASDADRMAGVVGDLFTDLEIGLEDAMALHRHLEQVLRHEVREIAPEVFAATEPALLTAVAHRFFNDLVASLAAGYLASHRGHDTDRDGAELELIECLLSSPPRVGAARQAARVLDIDLDVSWEVTVVAPEVPGTEVFARVASRIRRALWGAVVVMGSSERGLVVAVHRREASAPWPDLGPGFVCGVGATHPDVRGLRASHEEALEAVELARRKGLPILRFTDAWFDRFLLGAVSAAELAELVLAPVASLTPCRRAAVLETLEAYLDSGSSVGAVAAALHLHRQSVNYRMQNVRRLFGQTMLSPDGRLALHIAVKAVRLQRP